MSRNSGDFWATQRQNLKFYIFLYRGKKKIKLALNVFRSGPFVKREGSAVVGKGIQGRYT
jgi:hypothetical protein